MSILIGSTGLVGGHLKQIYNFDHQINRKNSEEIRGLETNLLVCAGLPAEKWIANQNPEADWANTTALAELLQTINSRNAILISTIDVYQPAFEVYEDSPITLNSFEAYGRNRAWFEVFFRSHFTNARVIRLPGLISKQLKKNFVFDLLMGNEDQIHKVDRDSEFQYFDMTELKNVINLAENNNVESLNVACQPVRAEEIANIFGRSLKKVSRSVKYDMRSNHWRLTSEIPGYLYSKQDTLKAIAKIMENTK